MSEIKTLEKLRSRSNLLPPMNAEILADEIQAEVDSRYMELPTDADGVVIKLGDVLEIEHGFGTKDIGEVTDIHLQEGKCAVSICFEYDSVVTAFPEDYHHVKPRTLENLLEELVRCASLPGEPLDRGDIEGFADEIRELLGSDAE